MTEKEKQIRKYVQKCFIDAFKAENREYDESLWIFEYILIKNSKGIFQMFPMLKCKFGRVLSRVEYRLKNNLMKNFKIQYGDTNELRCLLRMVEVKTLDVIDYNFTQAYMKIIDLSKFNKIRYFFVDIIDQKTNPYQNNLRGECMTGYTYEKLLFHYYDLDAGSYKIQSKNKEIQLPSYFRNNWDEFRSLYFDTFGKEIGSDYEIICSSGIQRI